MQNNTEFTQAQRLLETVIINAIDFFKRSINDIDDNPKYSIINFHASIELFLKARLFSEHWSKILVKPLEVSFTQFADGDFQSVSLSEAIKRLNKIQDAHISKEEKECFDRIRKHRNQLVHFIHPNYTDRPDIIMLSNMVEEQCKAWYLMHNILTKRWPDHFKKHLDRINELNNRLESKREYLHTRHQVIMSTINVEEMTGVNLVRCARCLYKSAKISETLGALSIAECVICSTRNCFLSVECPQCKRTAHIYDDENNRCEGCEYQIDLDDLFELFGEYPKPGDEHIQAYCNSCHHYGRPTVVPFDSKWLCLNCVSIYDTISQCSDCYEFISGRIFDSDLRGCMMCSDT